VPPSELSDSERDRYARQISTPLGESVQLRLKRSRALVVGAGAVGSTAAGYLAAAGVGYVGIADPEPVRLRDLSSQIVQLTPDVGAGKADAVAAKLGFLNPEVQVESYPVEVGEANAGAIFEDFDVVLDCTGEDPVKMPLRRACERLGVRLICARHPTAAEFPGPAAGTAGALAAAETLAAIVSLPVEAAT
jgi:molybdopterin/thiamine biosynthesis adenylyltransferase